MNIFIGLIVIIISVVSCAILHEYGLILHPSFYWFVGAFTGAVVVIITLGTI